MRNETKQENLFNYLGRSTPSAMFFYILMFYINQNIQQSLTNISCITSINIIKPLDPITNNMIKKHPVQTALQKLEAICLDPITTITDEMINPLDPVQTALQELRAMHQEPITDEMRIFLETFEKGTDISFKSFVTGIRQFTEFANLNPDHRKDRFGNRYRGLHYVNDLLTDWNEQHSDSVNSSQFCSLCPQEWVFINEEGTLAFLYKGEMPAEALDSFVKGPSVIDCGMFTQLSIWFGIRNMLGNEKFNELFGNAPFYITQFNYEEKKAPEKPYSGNPLYRFFSESTDGPGRVNISYLKNHEFYRLKHPGGQGMGHNCVEINKTYTIFDPLSSNTQDLSEDDIKNFLAEEFNRKQDEFDAHKLVANKKRNHSYVKVYGYLAERTISPNDCEGKVDSLCFDFEKFTSWVNEKSRVN